MLREGMPNGKGDKSSFRIEKRQVNTTRHKSRECAGLVSQIAERRELLLPWWLACLFTCGWLLCSWKEAHRLTHSNGGVQVLALDGLRPNR